MVTTNCVDLMGEGDCRIPLSGNNLDELKKNIFSHAQQHHPEKIKNMSSQDQAKVNKRIEEIWRSKSPAAGAPR